MGRRRKKVEKILKKTLPDFYLCPRCGKNTVKTTIFRKGGSVSVVCGNCGLNSVFKTGPQMDEVDAYNIFIDNYYETKASEEKAVG